MNDRKTLSFKTKDGVKIVADVVGPETAPLVVLLHGGGQTRVLKKAEQLIRARVKAQPDITLAELVERIAAATGTEAVSLMTMSNELRRLGLPRKKS